MQSSHRTCQEANGMWVALLIKAVPSSYDESKADCASSERVGIDMWVGTYRPSVRRPTQCGRHTGLRSSRAGGGVCITIHVNSHALLIGRRVFPVPDARQERGNLVLEGRRGGRKQASRTSGKARRRALVRFWLDLSGCQDLFFLSFFFIFVFIFPFLPR